MAELVVEGDVLSLSGELSVATVSRYYETGLAAIDQGASVQIDLAEANIVGSAGIALMIAWQRRALEQDKPITIVNAPEHFLDMAEVSGVRDILPFND